MNAPLPSTSPALPVVWVGECPAAGHPRQRPGCSAGPACGWTPHRGGPASFSLFSPVRPPVLSQSVTDARPVRCAESPPGTDGICHRVSTGHGGTGGILCARGHADLKQEIDKNTTVQKYNCTNVQTNKRTKVQKYKSTKVQKYKSTLPTPTKSTRRATVQRDARWIRPRHHFPLFHGKIWKSRSLCVFSWCVRMTRCGFPRGKTCASTPPGALSTPCFSFAPLTKRGTGRPQVAPVQR